LGQFARPEAAGSPLFAATPIRFPARSQIFRRRQRERAINRRPEKLMNNARRRERSHSRRRPMVSIYFHVPPFSLPPSLPPARLSRASTPRTTELAGAFDRLHAFRVLPRPFPLPACIMNVCHIRRLISVRQRRCHAETFATTPARLRYRFPMLAQLSLARSLARSRCPHRFAPLRLDGVKCAHRPANTRR